jgi:acetolactate synthase-1/2/3 large subunit
MSSQYNVGDLVAEFLSLCGVTTAFGIVSVHNIPTLDGIGRRNAIRFVMTRGELGASHMADGYARATDGLGVMITSTGPGSANAVAGLVEAQFAGAAVLHITGQTPTKFVDRGTGSVHDVPDQLGTMASSGKAAFRVRSASQALGTLMKAASLALTAPRGPVTVEVPIDIQRTPIERPAMFDRFALPVPGAIQPSAADLDELAERVAKAKRPMLWLGNGAKGARAGALALLELGFGAVSSWNGRGTVPEDHPMSIGGLNGNGAPLVQAFYDQCDLMLVVGSRMRAHETSEFSVKLPKNLIQVDIDPEANGRTYPSAWFMVGDAGPTLSGLASRLKGRLQVEAGYREAFGAMKAEARAAFKATLGPYASFADQLRAVMPADAIFVRDITLNNSTWGNRIFPILDPKTNIYPVGAGIGVGLHLGIGAALGAGGRKTVMMSGDGGFFLNMTELWTAAQERPDIVMVVMNDRGYGVIKHIQDSLYGGRRFYGDLLTPDLQQLAALAGVPSFKVTDGEKFGATVAEALAVSGPTLVEVDMTAIGTFPPYAPYDKKVS